MKDRTEEARAAEERDDYEEAYRIWKEIAEEDPQGVGVLKVGWMAFRLERWQEAQDVLEHVLELKPKAGIAMQMLGHLWLRRRDKDELERFRTAEVWFLKAAERGKTAPIMSVLGAVYTELDEKERAIESYEEALRIDEKYEEAMHNLAVLIGKDDPLRAIALLEAAVEIDPDYAVAHEELGKHYHRRKDLVRAEASFRRCLEINPADYWSNLYLANVLAVQGKHEESERVYEVAIRLHPEIEAGPKFFAKFLEQIGKHEKAAAVRGRVE